MNTLKLIFRSRKDRPAPEMLSERDMARVRVQKAIQFFSYHFDPKGRPITARGAALFIRYMYTDLPYGKYFWMLHQVAKVAYYVSNCWAKITKK